MKYLKRTTLASKNVKDEALKINRFGEVTADGKLAVGKTSRPNAELDIAGSANISDTINVSAVQTTILEPQFSNGDIILRANGTGNVVINNLLTVGEASTTFTGEVVDINNLRLDGDGAATGISAIDSNTSLYLNSAGTGGIYANGVDITKKEGNTFWVTQNGSDGNTGESMQDAFRTIRQALIVARNGDTVKIGSGTFEEIFPLTVYPGVSVTGQGIRSTQIKPTAATRTQNCFQFRGGGTVKDLTVREMEYDAINDRGYAFCFDESTTATFDRGPYVMNVTVLNFGSTVRLGLNPSDDPYGFNAGDAGRGVKASGQYVNRSSIEPSFLLNECTFFTPGQTAIVLKNGIRMEMLNSFCYLADKAVHATTEANGWGGQGRTYVIVENVTGGNFIPGETVRYTSTDGSTVAQFQIVSWDVATNTLAISGLYTGLDGVDFTPQYGQGGSIIGTVSGVQAERIVEVTKFEFGAELRAIGSAMVYGNQGVVAEGPGVSLRLISHNFGYIGTGKLTTNRASDAIQANEVVELTGAKVRYTSTDHLGDFRVGDLFYVSQETGEVQIDGSGLNFGALAGGLVFDDGAGNRSSITSTEVATETVDGKVSIVGTSIEASTFMEFDVSEEFILTTAGGALIDTTGASTYTLAPGDFRIDSSNVQLIGNTVIGGDPATEGDPQPHTLQVKAYIEGNLEPDPTFTGIWDIGSPTASWGTVYASAVQVDDIIIENNKIRVDVTNQDLEIDPAGAGSVLIGGTSFLRVPVGNTPERGANPLTGAIRFNTQIQQFEGYQGTAWSSLGGIKDIDGDTYVTPEVSPGSNDNRFDFYAGGVLIGEWNATDLTVNSTRFNNNNFTFENNTMKMTDGAQDYRFEITPGDVGEFFFNKTVNIAGDIVLPGGTISAPNATLTVTSIAATNFASDIIPDTDMAYDIGHTTAMYNDLYVAGIYTENFRIYQNRMSTLDSNSDFEFDSAGSGQFRFLGSSSVIVPVGGIATRPPGEVGQVRFNTDTNQYEGYNGIAWSSLGGVRDVDGDTYILPETSPGSNENTLYFYGGGIELARLTNQGWQGGILVDGNILIEGNSIKTTISNADLDLYANGVGEINLNDTTNIFGDLNVSLISTLPRIFITTLTPNRITYINTNNEIVTSDNFQFDDTEVIINVPTQINGNTTIDGIFSVTDTINAPNASIDFLTVNEDAFFTKNIYMDQIGIFGTRITTQETNAPLQLDAAGGGRVVSMTNMTVEGELFIQGDLYGSQTTQNVFNTTATTVNAFGSSTYTSFGSAAGTTRFNSNAGSTAYNTGAVVIGGGLGVGENVNIAGDLNVDGQDITTNNQNFNLLDSNIQFLNAFRSATSITFGSLTGTTNIQSTATSNSALSGALVVSGGVGIAENLYVDGIVNAANTTQSTSTTTGSIVTDGGVGIARNLNVGGTVIVEDTTQSTDSTTGSVILEGGLAVKQQLNVAGTVSVFESTEESSSSTTGAVVVQGGIGVGRDIYVGQDIEGSGIDLSYINNFTIDGGTY
jgi:hypothetical protein